MEGAHTQIQGGQSSQVLDIDLAEFFSRLSTIEESSGLTVAEICESTGKNQWVVRTLVKKAIAQGRCRAGKKQVTDISGRVLRVPCYVFSV